jgi:competence ComEA-like helix-hairpin-helix protein
MTKRSRNKHPSGFLIFLKEYFVFFNSERLGITALIVILIAVVILPLFFRSNEISVEDVERLKKEMDTFLAAMESQSQMKHRRDTVFMFDPNLADSTSLTLLGFSPAQAKSIINYRNKGGRFYNKESFGKSFAVSDEMFTRLYYYIDIKPQPSGKQKGREKAADFKTFSEPKKISEPKELNNTKKVYTIEINSADFDELQKFRGIGEYYAKKIVEYRDRLGGFCKAEQLMEIKGIDSVRFDMFRNQIRIDTSHIRRIKINSVTENDLAKHPYINNFVAKSIIKYRKFKGTITSGSEMTDEKVITKKQLEKIAAYIEYDNARN